MLRARGPLGGISCYRSPRGAGEARLADPDGPARPLPAPLWEGGKEGGRLRVSQPAPAPAAPERGEEKRSHLLQAAGMRGREVCLVSRLPACQEALGKGRGKSLLTARSPCGGSPSRSLSTGIFKGGNGYAESHSQEGNSYTESQRAFSWKQSSAGTLGPLSLEMPPESCNGASRAGCRRAGWTGAEPSKTDAPAFWKLVLAVY